MLCNIWIRASFEGQALPVNYPGQVSSTNYPRTETTCNRDERILNESLKGFRLTHLKASHSHHHLPVNDSPKSATLPVQFSVLKKYWQRSLFKRSYASISLQKMKKMLSDRTAAKASTEGTQGSNPTVFMFCFTKILLFCLIS